ncbi:MAG: S8 family serine peptidase [Clostridia bacterium]|nr:S8 family serine peptidase [Clostridia bacterium]
MMKRLISVILCAVSIAWTGEIKAAELDDSGNDEVVTLIVETTDEALIEKAEAQAAGMKAYLQTAVSDIAESSLIRTQAAILNNIERNIEPSVEKGYTYTMLFSGFSVDAPMSCISEIEKIPGVKSVYVSKTWYLPEEPEAEAKLGFSGDMINTDYAVSNGYNGEGELIAVIDAGCQTDHDMFSHAPANPAHTKESMSTLIESKTLNAGSDISTVYKSEKIPFAYNYALKSGDVYYESFEHGTHVSSIACGKDGTLPNGEKFSGIAPEAQLLFMCSGNSGGGFSDAAVRAAYNDAIALGADVINASYGAEFDDPQLDASYSSYMDKMRNAGIFLSVSAGNEARGYKYNTPLAEDPDYGSINTPSSYSSATSVASVTNSYTYTSGYRCALPDGTEIDLYKAFDGSSFSTLFGGSTNYVEYVDCGYGLVDDFTDKDLSGKIALVKRGNNAFTEKSNNAKAAGAVGMILINSSDDAIATVSLSLPTAIAIKSTGEMLAAYEDKKMRYLKVIDLPLKSPIAGQSSWFTSWGVDSTLDIKPEISAPGGGIYGAVPGNNYKILSGTSMAAPHISGAAAIMDQYYKTSDSYNAAFSGLTGDDKITLIEKLMMSSADIVRQSDGVPYSVRQQGAGMVNLENMMNASVVLTGNGKKAKIKLGAGLDETIELSFTATNVKNTDVTYDTISVEATTDTYVVSDGKNYLTDVRYAGAITAKKLDIISSTLPESITIPAGETVTVTGTVTLDNAQLEENKEIFTSGFFIDGFVSLEQSEGAAVKASVPFTGFYGDWSAARIFDKTIYDDGGSTIIDPNYKDFGGTQLYARVSDGTRFTLGRNPYSNKSMPKEFIAYNNERADGKTNDFVVSMQNYRFVYQLDFKLFDSQNNLVAQDSTKNPNGTRNMTNKFLLKAYKTVPNFINDKAEGEYTLRVEGDSDGDGTADDSFELPVTVDRTNPELVAARYNETNNTLVIVARDNHYLSRIYAIYSTTDGKTWKSTAAFDDQNSIKKGGAVSVSMDLGNSVDYSSVKIVCEDYAGNSSEAAAYLYTDKIGVTFDSEYQSDTVTDLKFTIRNNIRAQMDTNIITALYDADGILVTVKKEGKTLPLGNTKYSFTELGDWTSAKKVKLFFWDESENMKNIDTAKEFDLK